MLEVLYLQYVLMLQFIIIWFFFPFFFFYKVKELELKKKKDIETNHKGRISFSRSTQSIDYSSKQNNKNGILVRLSWMFIIVSKAGTIEHRLHAHCEQLSLWAFTHRTFINIPLSESRYSPGLSTFENCMVWETQNYHLDSSTFFFFCKRSWTRTYRRFRFDISQSFWDKMIFSYVFTIL